MLGSYTLNFILLYIICGYLTAYFGLYILRHSYLGHTWGAILISVIGSFLGALGGTLIFRRGLSVSCVVTAVAVSALSLYIYGMASRFHHD